jgi:S1-C subfamily serine protease
MFEDQMALRLGVQEGALIHEVFRSSGAASAGLRPTLIDEDGKIQLGDVLNIVAGRSIRSTLDVLKALDGHKPGDLIQVVFHRNQQQMAVEVKLQSASAER